MSVLLDFGAGLYALAWEARRRAYAAGWVRPVRVGTRVVSVGNLTIGGTGKTTLVLHLAARARERGVRVAVVCRRYRPGPGGFGDEELLYREALGAEPVFAGRTKWKLARQAAAAGFERVLVDDGFSHWRLARDLDILLVDATAPWGGGALLPAGRLREPRRAMQRAGAVVLTRVDSDDGGALAAEVRPFAPAAVHAAGRHRTVGVHARKGAPPPSGTRAWIVTATGNPDAVRRSASAAGLEIAGLTAYRDHHWFSAAQAQRAIARATACGAFILMTRKDAVRWPDVPGAAAVLDVAWEWVREGDAVERLVLEGGASK